MNRYTSVTYPDINNGSGFRTTLWISGCGHRCPGCHNEWMWDYSIGKPLEESWKEVIMGVWHEYCQGLTIGGGDPLMRDEGDLQEIKEYIKRYRKVFPTKDIWLYTGYDLEEMSDLQKEVCGMCDVVCTGRYVEELKDLSLPFRGSSNQHLYNVIRGGDGCVSFSDR